MWVTTPDRYHWGRGGGGGCASRLRGVIQALLSTEADKGFVISFSGDWRALGIVFVICNKLVIKNIVFFVYQIMKCIPRVTHCIYQYSIFTVLCMYSIIPNITHARD